METLVICVYNGKTLHNKNKNIYYSKLEFYVDFMTADQSLFSKHVDFHWLESCWSLEFSSVFSYKSYMESIYKHLDNITDHWAKIGCRNNSLSEIASKFNK